MQNLDSSAMPVISGLLILLGIIVYLCKSFMDWIISIAFFLCFSPYSNALMHFALVNIYDNPKDISPTVQMIATMTTNTLFTIVVKLFIKLKAVVAGGLLTYSLVFFNLSALEGCSTAVFIGIQIAAAAIGVLLGFYFQKKIEIIMLCSFGTILICAGTDLFFQIGFSQKFYQLWCIRFEESAEAKFDFDFTSPNALMLYALSVGLFAISAAIHFSLARKSTKKSDKESK